MTRSLTVDVARAVADIEDTDPSELGYVLQNHIDTDALDELAAHSSAAWTLSFELPGHVVTVTSDGTIGVDGVDVTEVSMDRYRDTRRSRPVTAD